MGEEEEREEEEGREESLYLYLEKEAVTRWNWGASSQKPTWLT